MVTIPDGPVESSQLSPHPFTLEANSQGVCGQHNRICLRVLSIHPEKIAESPNQGFTNYNGENLCNLKEIHTGLSEENSDTPNSDGVSLSLQKFGDPGATARPSEPRHRSPNCELEPRGVRHNSPVSSRLQTPSAADFVVHSAT